MVSCLLDILDFNTVGKMKVVKISEKPNFIIVTNLGHDCYAQYWMNNRIRTFYDIGMWRIKYKNPS